MDYEASMAAIIAQEHLTRTADGIRTVADKQYSVYSAEANKNPGIAFGYVINI